MSLLAFRCHEKTVIQMYRAHSLYWLKSRMIRLPDLLLARKWIHSVNPFLELQPLIPKLSLTLDSLSYLYCPGTQGKQF